MIVFDDADLNVAVPTLTAAVTTFAGQFCMCGSRILVQDTIAEEFRTRMIASLSAVQPGPAASPDSRIGPMIDHNAVARVDALIENASDVEVIVRGGTTEGAGSFYRPALLGVQDLWGQVFDQFEEGGYKRSGIGRLNGLGGLAEFQEVKHVVRPS